MPKATAASISLADLSGELVGFRAAQHATLDQGTSEARHRVATQRGLVLRAVAEDCDRFVLRIVQRHARRRDDVAVGRKAVDLRLDQGGTGARASAFDGRTDGGIHGERIGSIDRDAGHRERLGLGGQGLAVRRIRVLLRGGRHDVVAVVFHHEDRGELPQ